MKTRALIFFPLIVVISSSCSEKYYTEADFHKIKKIDAHIHIRTTTDAVSDQAKKIPSN
jgi:hypothetical protein